HRRDGAAFAARRRRPRCGCRAVKGGEREARDARMPGDLDNASVEKAYARWAPVYDLVFDKLMASGRRAAVAAAMRTGQLIADVGIGTGLELRYFSADARIVGIDLS